MIEARDINTLNYSPERLAEAISAAKNKLITADQYEPRSGSMLGRVVAEVYPAYQERLLASSAVDFDDLLLHVAQLLYDHAEIRAELDERYRYVLVDEYQDTNRAQYVILRALSTDYPNLAVTGDPDQSIYGWRGADLNNILEFEHDYPEREDRAAGAELSQHEADSARGRRADRPQPAPQEEGAVDRERRGRGGAAGRVRRSGPRSGGHRRADSRRGRRGPAQAERLRDFLPRERACRGHWKRRCARPACRTRWSAARSFMPARKSRTCWPTASWSTTRATTWRSSGRSTRRRAASAARRSSG